MTPAALTNGIVRALEAAGIDRWSGVGDIPAPDAELPYDRRRGFFKKPRIQWAHHFVPRPDVLVCDTALGTLGLVNVLRKKQPVAESVRRFLSEAAYLRHILLTDPSGAGAWPYIVELVLVSDDPDVRSRASAELQQLAKSSSALPEIGVSFLGDPADPDDFRRAFPWLLVATRKWYEKELDSPLPDNEATREWTERVGPLTSVELDHYRLAHGRTLDLGEPREPLPAGHTRVHLVHGPNGTGKSALCEALEFVATGSIERLQLAVEAGTDYRNVLEHQPPTGRKERRTKKTNPAKRRRARIVINGEHPFSVGAKGLQHPKGLAAFLGEALSLRLNQAAMDELARGRPQFRAKSFLGAFFSRVAESSAALERARRAQESASDDLLELREQLRHADSLLAGLGRWTAPATKGKRRPLSLVLDEWLEQIALVDVGERYLGVLQLLERAAELGWSPRGAIAELFPATPSDALSEQLPAWKKRRDTLLDELSGVERTGGSAASSEHQDVPVLSADDEEILDSVGAWILGKEKKSLGATIRRALQERTSIDMEWGAIGFERGWSKKLRERIKWLLRACESPSLFDAAEPWLSKTGKPGSVTRRLREADTMVAETLADQWRKVEINDAVNELLALASPARWAYRDVKIRLDRIDGEERLDFVFDTRSSQEKHTRHADLVLNSAELTSLALALFLLNAPRLPNPLRTLVLDDPLQNLDEMSVKSVARGIARLIRLPDWAPGWSALFLLHGEQDSDRFCAELPATRHEIPWLSLRDATQEVPITRSEGDRRGYDLLSLKQYATDLPPAAGGAREKRKTAKRKTANRKTTKRKTAKRKTTKRKTAKRKTAKRGS